MDRNNLTGFILMMAVLFGYFIFFSPDPVPPPAETVKKDSTIVAAPKTTTVDTALASLFIADTTVNTHPLIIRNQDIEVTFTPSASIQRAELLNYKTYSQEPLQLITEGTSTFRMGTAINGKEVDLFAIPYQSDVIRQGDSTTVRFTGQGADGSYVRHTWTLAPKGFLLKYRLETKDIVFQRENIEFQWLNKMPLVEKDLNDSRSKTGINFRTADEETDGTSESSLDVETMSLPEGTRWVGMKQKFFLSAILSQTGFAGGEIETRVNEADSSTVKTGKVLTRIPTAAAAAGGVALQFYLGPNNYKTLGEIADGFQDNVYLGWPPVHWVNEYLIVPLFYFLSSLTSSYGLIIIILVLVIRLVLLPLSYKSYLGMAKMRLLKPELDEIKKKYPDDQVKFSQEQMKLFSEAGASPLAGCIPLLLQMPILFAMFYLFPSIIDFRQQTLPFAEDISTYDSVLQLPFSVPFMGSHISIYTLLMTISTLVITWQNNQMSTVEGPMKSLSYIMPAVFFFVLNSFPASLSFYYLVGNVASFAQQLLIRRFVDEDKVKAVMEAHRKKLAANPSAGKSAFMNRLNEAMKASEEARKASAEARKNNKRS